MTGSLASCLDPAPKTPYSFVIVPQLQERYYVVNKTLYMAFVELEKSFGHIPRRVIAWALRKLGIEE